MLNHPVYLEITEEHTDIQKYKPTTIIVHLHVCMCDAWVKNNIPDYTLLITGQYTYLNRVIRMPNSSPKMDIEMTLSIRI